VWQIFWLAEQLSMKARVFVALLVSLTVGLLFAILISVVVGAVAVPVETVTRVVLSNLGLLQRGDWSVVHEQIVWEFRMPRVLLAVIVGAALAVSGATLQAVARNTLADPYVFGVSYGATAAAVAVIALGAGAAGGASLSAAAFGGALLAMVVVYLLAQQGGHTSPTRLVLAGVALSYVLSALTSYLVLRSATPGGGGAAAVLTWLAGSLGGSKWSYLGLPALVVLLCTGWLLLRARLLNALLAGEESAVGLGVNVQRFRLELFVITSLLVGVVVSISGAIGFVGLMIPHLARMGAGADHRRVLPVVMLGGALFLVLADLVSRVALAPQELPVGIVTAAIGGPFFLWMLRQRMMRGAS
jgi:iron complex transport system permease protein